VFHLCEFYPGICLTTEEKARKNFSQGKKNLSQVKKNLSQSTVYVIPKYPHIHTHTQLTGHPCTLAEGERTIWIGDRLTTKPVLPKKNLSLLQFEQLLGCSASSKSLLTGINQDDLTPLFLSVLLL
jgi:hypothetical protein